MRARLVGALLLAVGAIAAVQMAVTWRTANDEMQAVFDAQMQRIALSLTGGLAASVLGPEPLARTQGAQDLIIQIWRADGVMLYRSPSERLLPPQGAPGFSNVSADGVPFRVYVLRTATQRIQVAQDVAARRQAAGQLALRAVAPVALLAPLLMLIVWGVVTRALAPLARVRQQVAARRADDLAPLSADGLPAELRPLIDEFNALLARLAAAWDALTHFTADAAHELRTPLAALRLQAQSLQRAATPEARQIAAERLGAGIDRATRLVEQLLALARQEGAARAAPVAVDVAALARTAVQDMQPQAQASRIALTADAPAPVRRPGQPDALAVLLRNLLDNALRHTPAGGQVRVRVRPGGAGAAGDEAEMGGQADEAGKGAVLCVEDSGPGIAPPERTRVLDRFYRAPGTPGHGSGLGLSIVRAVADAHGAHLRIDSSPELGGARVQVCWPE
ncbi:MAG: ATP-binding protein [Pseudomonadota bacterium]|nr:ATP-binding protein [Pseudomonadota bacterium]